MYIYKEASLCNTALKNDILRLTVDTHGAEPVSVIHKPTRAELLWRGDPAVWGRHAPILFPYTGKLTGGKMIAKGVGTRAASTALPGMWSTMTHHTEALLEFELHVNAETLPKWPYAFVLRSTFTLEGETVHHTLTVENPVEEELRFGIGYHPAFAFPSMTAMSPGTTRFALTASSRRSASVPSPTACSTARLLSRPQRRGHPLTGRFV